MSIVSTISTLGIIFVSKIHFFLVVVVGGSGGVKITMAEFK